MKKLVLIAIAFVTLQATAQPQHRGDQKRGQRSIERLQNFSAEELAEIQTKRMTLQLDLTDAQQQEVRELLVAQNKARKEKLEAFKKAREENQITERPSKEDRLENLNERLDNQIAMKRKMKEILSEEQYSRWEKSLAIKARKNKRGGKGRRGLK